MPTTSARRQWAVATVVVVEDIDHVDHAVNEVHQKSHELVTDHVGVDTKVFPGKPQDV